MGFWLFMLCMDLICPFTMIGFGKRCMNNTPDFDSVYGYRTRMSSINRKTWKFAHEYCGKLWYLTGLTLLTPSIIIMLFTFGKGNDAIGVVGGILEAIQIMLLLAAIPATESMLRKKFEDNGKRKYTQNITGINITKKEEKEKQFIKIMGWIMLGLDILAFISLIISLNIKIWIAISVLVLLLAWGLYIWMYPKHFLDLSQTIKIWKRKIGIPVFSIGLAAFFCWLIFDLFNYAFSDFMIFLGIFMIVLLIPFILKIYIIEEAPEKSSVMATVLVAFFLAFIIVLPVNYLATFQGDGHESIIVNDKDIFSTRRNTRYYIYADWREENQQFSVFSSREYEEFQKGDSIQVCLHHSIFGFQYWTVHK